MYRLFITIIIVLVATMLILPGRASAESHAIPVRAVDTMKISRDIAREIEDEPIYTTEIIPNHVKKVAATGATHIAINTPYDDEFLPLMRVWVSAARKEGLSVWYRGNFSGWEGWFDYKDITREQHLTMLKRFLENNPDLFQDGDIFTACMECENGDPNAPWTTDPTEFRNFMIAEYNAMNSIFRKQGVDVKTNYNSMNGVLALKVYDKKTTRALGGVVGIDHYVATPEQLEKDIKIIAESSGGKVVIGELGVPIPDIHGADMPEKEQAEWMAIAFSKLQAMPEVIAVNYWTSWGGSTALFDNKGWSSEVSKVVTNFYTDKTVDLKIVDADGSTVPDVTVKAYDQDVHKSGKVFKVPYLYEGQIIQVNAPGYPSHAYVMNDGEDKITLELHPLGVSKAPEKSPLSWTTLSEILLSPVKWVGNLFKRD